MLKDSAEEPVVANKSVKAQVSSTEHQKLTEQQKLTELHSRVCNFFGEYQESDKDLQTACKLPATNETSKSILSSLRSLQADYQRCEKKESCRQKMDTAQLDNLKHIKEFIAEFPQTKRSSFGVEIQQLQKQLKEDLLIAPINQSANATSTIQKTNPVTVATVAKAPVTVAPVAAAPVAAASVATIAQVAPVA